MIFNKIKAHNQKGVAIYLVVVIMAVLLGLGLGLNALLVDQIKAFRGIGDSVIAFYAAEAGIEAELFWPPVIGAHHEGTLSSDAQYVVDVIDKLNPECDGLNFCIRSVGSFKQSKRAIWSER